MTISKNCSIDGCTNTSPGARGFCQMHYVRFKVHGSPFIKLTDLKRKSCLIDGCLGKHKGHGYCTQHYNRFKKGLPITGELKTLNPKRYVVVTDRNHPLAFKNGRVYKHRKVLFDQVGGNGGRLPCFWCGKPLDWFGFEFEKLMVDHLNHDRHNNEPTNLVPSCNSCNAGRMIGSRPRQSIYSGIKINQLVGS